MKRFDLMKKIFSILLTAMILITTISLIRANAEEEYSITYNADEDTYYSDGYFKESSLIYNPHLATISMQMANRSSPAGSPKTNDLADEWYLTQYKSIQTFYERIGFEKFSYNEDYTVKTSFNTIGLAAAQRKATYNGEEYTIVSIVPRSGNYGLEWANNMWLGRGTESDFLHEGWYNAANRLIVFLKDYVATNVTTRNVKIWMSGFSRGGATTNIAAGLLDNMLNNGEKIFGENINITRENIYAYTFEAPQGANVNVMKMPKPKEAIYNNIWNIINPNDLVPKVAMKQYGFTRFGQDKYITTQFYDAANYTTNRDIFKKLLVKHMTLDEYEADKFDVSGLSVEAVGKTLGYVYSASLFGEFKLLNKDETKKNYDSNIAVSLLIDEFTKNLGTRKDYVERYQTNIRDLMLLFMDGYEANAKKIALSVAPAIAGMVYGVIVYDITKSASLVNKVFDFIQQAMPDANIRKMSELLMFICDPIIHTYWERPNELISLIDNIGPVFQNHSTEVTSAHLQAQDSYYIDAYNNSHDDKISLVPLRDNADYGRIIFDGFNDVKILANGNTIGEIEGFVLGKSVIHKCEPGIALGYYSYVTEERIEAYLPTGNHYAVYFKDYSKKPWHTFTLKAYKVYGGRSSNYEYEELKDYFQDSTWFNSSRYFNSYTF